LNFNADAFNTQVRACDYYGFVSMTMIACGIVFQVPEGVLAATGAEGTAATLWRPGWVGADGRG
jgi:Sec-independent protein secretion pathway component TatC